MANPNTNTTDDEKWTKTTMDKRLLLEGLKRVIENSYTFTEDVKRSMTIFTVFYSITFILGVVFVYVNAHFQESQKVPRIVRNSIAGVGTFASLLTSMKTISETLSSARTKEITISNIDLNIVNLAIDNGPDDNDLKELRDLIESRNNKLEKLRFYRSLWAFFFSYTSKEPSQNKYFLKDIRRYKQFVISRVTFQQRNRNYHNMNGESEKVKAEHILHGLGKEIV
ncbi:4432_t:CDS:2 [Funneliformis caledonium]|uniref:4432_t:CDS:1 n=1 Tax=Funneliformis caledonium TaxID=1117310 RepID=A0A9N9AGR9_9GLOM|nr:4432_t:CDS:2 [Funneliformis caledonium]